MQVQRTALGECQAYVFKLILIKTVFPVTDKGVKTSQLSHPFQVGKHAIQKHANG